MKFLVDAQLPKALSDWLVQIGYDSIHTLDLPSKNKTTDLEISRISEEEHRIIITKDVDFYDSFVLQGRPKKLLLITTGNITNQISFKIIAANFESIAKYFDKYHLIELNSEHLIIHR